MKVYDPSHLDRAAQYKLLAGAVVPRPVALVTTLGPGGINAAPFSFFNVLGVKPPMVMFSVGMRDGGEKDTVANLRDCPEMVIHLVDEANAEAMHICSATLPRGVNELEVAGLATLPSVMVRPPRIASCPVHLECVLDRMLPFGEVPYTLVIARIVYMHFDEAVVDDAFHIDIGALRPVARVTGQSMYLRSTDLFQLPPADLLAKTKA